MAAEWFLYGMGVFIMGNFANGEKNTPKLLLKQSAFVSIIVLIGIFARS